MIDCNYYKNGICSLASDIANTPATTNVKACVVCKSSIHKMTINNVTVSLAIKANKSVLTSKPELKKFLVRDTIDIGPGTELKKLISWFPIPKKANCRSCRNLEIRMNRWGPDICLQKMDFICKKLHIAAKRRNLPFSKTIAISMVNKAIQNATNNIR